MLFDDGDQSRGGGVFGQDKMRQAMGIRTQNAVQPQSGAPVPMRDPRNFTPPPPLRGPRGGYQPPTPMRDPRNFTPPPPMAQPQGGPVNWGNVEKPVGGGGGPMPVPPGGPHWRQGGLWDQPVGGGGGPMPVPDGGPHWRQPVGDQDRTPTPMPLPPTGVNWRNAPTDQPSGGGGGPMPVPPPWVTQGGKPEDYGVTMEFGGPGAINPISPTTGMVMSPDELRKFYNPAAPPPPPPNPQMSAPPAWQGGGGLFDAGGQGLPQALLPYLMTRR